MPKSLAQLKEFHGGLSTNSSTRDIANNELVSAKDIMVDEIGQIRNMGSNVAHDAGTLSADINAGYGLHQFSNDYRFAHVGGQHLNNTQSFGSNWTANTAFSAGSTITIANGTGSTLSGYIEQAHSDRKEVGTPLITYEFEFTISNFTVGTDMTDHRGTFYIKNTFATTQVDLFPYLTNGTHRVRFTSASGCATAAFRIGADFISSGTSFDIDNVSLIPYSSSADGDHYLALADNEDDDAAIYIYSNHYDAWSAAQRVTMGTGSGLQAVMYSIDGALRITDASFNTANSSAWLGHIDRELWKNISPSYRISEWHGTGQHLSPPSLCRMHNDLSLAGIVSGGDDNTPDSTDTTSALSINGVDNVNPTSHFITRADLLDINQPTASDGIMSNVGSVKVDWEFQVDTSAYDNKPSGASYTKIGITCGTYSTTGDDAWIKSNEVIVVNGDLPSGEYKGTTWFYLNIEDTDTGVEWKARSDGSSSATTDRVRVSWSNAVSNVIVANTLSLSVVMYENGTVQHPDDSSGSGSNFYGSMQTGHIFANVDWESSGGANWQSADNDKVWEFGSSFIYDGNQESAITSFKNHRSNSTSFNTGSATGINVAPCFRFFFQDWADSNWNKRVTGFNFYAREKTSKIDTNWYLQAKGDFVEGKITSMATGQQFDAKYKTYGTSFEPTYIFDLHDDEDTNSNISSTANPTYSNVISYNISSGVSQDNEITGIQYKTAVISNRQAYFGNLNITEGNKNSVLGDAIMKSPVNKFDVFSRSRIIEASVRDGDDIVKLETYADRLLEFKQRKLTILNIAQDMEFVEDVFNHKGVNNPAAVCKTDFGIAWVNNLGCYIYDGRQVSNILEKGGRQIIKESEWATFTANNPMIGYVPKKRQLIVVDDVSTSGDGSIYLYDMVTQSWVKSSSGLFQDQAKTNFVTDWNGDLMYAYNNSNTATFMKWDDTSVAKSGIEIITKETDFGQPAQRKKVYKLYISYRGGNPSLDVEYSTDSGANWNAMDVDLLETGTSTTYEACIKPNNSISNTKTIMFKISGPTSAGFRINDMSIVFRGKAIK